MSNDIDQHIRDALRAEDQELAALLDDQPNLFEQAVATFKGSSRFLNILSVALSIVLFALSIVCAVRFFQADTTHAMLAWAVGFMWSSMAVAALKIWFWMEMQRHQITREIKRVELEIVALARRLER